MSNLFFLAFLKYSKVYSRFFHYYDGKNIACAPGNFANSIKTKTFSKSIETHYESPLYKLLSFKMTLQRRGRKICHFIYKGKLFSIG